MDRYRSPSHEAEVVMRRARRLVLDHVALPVLGTALATTLPFAAGAPALTMTVFQSATSP